MVRYRSVCVWHGTISPGIVLLSRWGTLDAHMVRYDSAWYGVVFCVVLARYIPHVRVADPVLSTLGRAVSSSHDDCTIRCQKGMVRSGNIFW